MRDLIPWGRSRSPARREEGAYEGMTPFFTLRREMDRLFDDALRNFGIHDVSAFASAGWPHVEVLDRDKEVRVTAEIPGLDEEDIELQVEDDVLTLRGEKRTEFEDEERRYSERHYGRFERRIALPAEVDDDRASATFKKGVLTVVLPKVEGARRQKRRIPISGS